MGGGWSVRAALGAAEGLVGVGVGAAGALAAADAGGHGAPDMPGARPTYRGKDARDQPHAPHHRGDGQGPRIAVEGGSGPGPPKSHEDEAGDGVGCSETDQAGNHGQGERVGHLDCARVAGGFATSEDHSEDQRSSEYR